MCNHVIVSFSDKNGEWDCNESGVGMTTVSTDNGHFAGYIGSIGALGVYLLTVTNQLLGKLLAFLYAVKQNTTIGPQLELSTTHYPG